MRKLTTASKRWLPFAAFLCFCLFYVCRKPETCATHIEAASIPETPQHLVGFFSAPPRSLLARGATVTPAWTLLAGEYVPGPGPSRIIHQTWKNSNASTYPLAVALHGHLHWRAKHPGWQYVLWRDEDNRELVKTRYPEWLDMYDHFDSQIMRVDFVRNLYMHAFGGVYVDLDVVPLSNLEDHLPSFRPSAQTQVPVAYVGKMAWASDLAIANAFLASSVPKHPFFMHVAERSLELIALSKSNRVNRPSPGSVEALTGPGVLGWAAQNWIGSTKASFRYVGKRRIPIHYEAPNGVFGVLDNDKHGRDWLDPDEEMSEEYSWQARMEKGGYGEVIVIGNGKIYPYSWSDPVKGHHCVCSSRFPKTFDPDRCLGIWEGAWLLGFWGSSWYNWTPTVE